jgi:predicted DCC family thiol-disulfide oxidoreductase YuxK
MLSYPLSMTRPVLVFDGDCGFCTTCAQFTEKRIRPDAEVVAWQFADLPSLGVTEEQATDAVQWVETEGKVLSGHEAIAAMLISSGPIWGILGRTLLLPGISWAAAHVYRLVGDNRHRLPGGTPACQR